MLVQQQSSWQTSQVRVKGVILDTVLLRLVIFNLIKIYSVFCGLKNILVIGWWTKIVNIILKVIVDIWKIWVTLGSFPLEKKEKCPPHTRSLVALNRSSLSCLSTRQSQKQEYWSYTRHGTSKYHTWVGMFIIRVELAGWLHRRKFGNIIIIMVVHFLHIRYLWRTNWYLNVLS